MRIAEGMRDLLPEELAWLEQRESRVLSLFQAWSYRKVLTTGLEYGACVEPEMTRKGDLYKFFDREGLVLALRPEFTTPIARLVSSRLRHEDLPLRLCYSGDVYRNGVRRYHEFRQTGVELIGSENETADAEVIALAIEMMRCLDLRDFRISLGHIGVFSDLADELSLPSKLRKDLEDGLTHKDMVRMNALLSECSLPEKAGELLRLLPSLTGGAEVLNKLEEYECFASVRQAAGSLRRIYDYLMDFGVQEHVLVDLGILRGFAYYSGIIFEGYIPQMGFPVLEGGRYDRLYADFGLNTQATGFAFNLEALLALREPTQAADAEVLVYGDSPKKVIQRCQELRRTGQKVEMALGCLSADEAQQRARVHCIPRVEAVNGESEPRL